MRGKERTSHAKYFHARLNPIHENEARVINIIDEREKQGINFKQLIVALIDGATLEAMTPKTNVTLEQIEELLSRFAENLSVKGNNASVFEDREEAPSTEFVHNFARGFMARTDSPHPTDDLQYEDISE